MQPGDRREEPARPLRPGRRPPSPPSSPCPTRVFPMTVRPRWQPDRPVRAPEPPTRTTRPVPPRERPALPSRNQVEDATLSASRGEASAENQRKKTVLAARDRNRIQSSTSAAASAPPNVAAGTGESSPTSTEKAAIPNPAPMWKSRRHGCRPSVLWTAARNPASDTGLRTPSGGGPGSRRSGLQRAAPETAPVSCCRSCLASGECRRPPGAGAVTTA